MNSQCRPRVYGFKEPISYYNKRHNYHYIYFTIIIEFFIYLQVVSELRLFRKQEAAHNTVARVWMPKVKQS